MKRLKVLTCAVYAIAWLLDSYFINTYPGVKVSQSLSTKMKLPNNLKKNPYRYIKTYQTGKYLGPDSVKGNKLKKTSNFCLRALARKKGNDVLLIRS